MNDDYLNQIVIKKYNITYHHLMFINLTTKNFLNFTGHSGFYNLCLYIYLKLLLQIFSLVRK